MPVDFNLFKSCVLLHFFFIKFRWYGGWLGCEKFVFSLIAGILHIMVPWRIQLCYCYQYGCAEFEYWWTGFFGSSICGKGKLSFGWDGSTCFGHVLHFFFSSDVLCDIFIIFLVCLRYYCSYMYIYRYLDMDKYFYGLVSLLSFRV